MRLRFGTIFVAAVLPFAAVAGEDQRAAQVKCPVSANMRGHENIEWSTYYGFHLTDKNRHLPRVLLVGDSICNGYQAGVARALEGKMNVSYWISSYCVTSPGYLQRFELCAALLIGECEIGFHVLKPRIEVLHFSLCGAGRPGQNDSGRKPFPSKT